jgi:hypothetical protein
VLTSAGIFHVLTEFKFGIGEALLHSNQLQSAVTGISDAADTALLSLTKLGASSALGSLSGLGFAGMLGKAVEISDKFALSQNALANIISSNMEHLQGDIGTFNDRLSVTETIMGRISKAAREFALDEDAMLDMTKLTAAQLIPKGLAGDNFGNAIDLSRNLLKSAPSLGIDPNEIQGQLLRAIEGSASMGDTLFRRLVSDTKAMGSLMKGPMVPGATTVAQNAAPMGGPTVPGVMGLSGGLAKVNSAAMKFNAMPTAQRFKLLSTAMGQFASDTNVLKANVESLSGQFRLMNTLVFGRISSVLRPIGEALRKPIIRVLQQINSFIDGPAREMMKTFADMITKVLDDPRKFLIQLLQLKQLKKDTNLAATILSVVEAMSSFAMVLTFLRKVLPIPAFGVLGRVLKFVGEGVNWLVLTVRGWLGSLGKFLFSMKGLTFLFNVAKFAIGSILLPLTLLTTILQGLSRGMALAKVEDTEAMIRMMPVLLGYFARITAAIQNFMLPINLAIEGIGQLTKHIFKWSNTVEPLLGPLDLLIRAFEILSSVVVKVMAVISATFASLFRMVENWQKIQSQPKDTSVKGRIMEVLVGEPLAKLATSPNSLGDGVAGTWQDEFDRFVSENDRTVKQGKGVQNNVTNNNFSGNITIRNDFKEQQEPDRIAFKMSEQLQKIGQNRTQARGRSLKAGFVGAGGQ